MKFVTSRILVAVLLVTLAGVTAMAGTKKSTFEFRSDTKLNDTVIKKGTYDVSFDRQTGELSILKRNKVVAKSAARLEKRDGKSRYKQFALDNQGSLVSITFGDSNEDVVITPAPANVGN
jgi:hypothetical protein